MEQRQLGTSTQTARRLDSPTGLLTTSAIGLGCMGLSQGYGPTDDTESIRLIRRAVDLGVRMFDTAISYGRGHNETLLGRALAGRREDVTVATKFGIVRDENGVHLDGRPERVRGYCDASLQRLGVEAIDLYYLHRVDPQVADTIAAMIELVEAGKVRHLGVSEVTVDQLDQATAVHPITAVQFEWSLLWRQPEAEIMPAARLPRPPGRNSPARVGDRRHGTVRRHRAHARHLRPARRPRLRRHCARLLSPHRGRGIELADDDHGRERRFELLQALTRTQALDDLAATIEWIATRRASLVGMVGLSVGGHLAYLAATRFALPAVAIFYGGWIPTTDITISQPEATIAGTEQISGRVQIFVGSNDPVVPADHRHQLTEALTAAGIDHQLIQYRGVGHGFLCDRRASFHPEAANDAWSRLLRFLEPG